MKSAFIFGSLITGIIVGFGSSEGSNILGAFLLAGIIPGTHMQLPWYVMLGGAIILPLVLMTTPLVLHLYRKDAHTTLARALVTSRLLA